MPRRDPHPPSSPDGRPLRAVPGTDAADDYCVDVDTHEVPPVWVTPEDCTPPGVDHIFRIQDP